MNIYQQVEKTKRELDIAIQNRTIRLHPDILRKTNMEGVEADDRKYIIAQKQENKDFSTALTYTDSTDRANSDINALIDRNSEHHQSTYAKTCTLETEHNIRQGDLRFNMSIKRSFDLRETEYRTDKAEDYAFGTFEFDLTVANKAGEIQSRLNEKTENDKVSPKDELLVGMSADFVNKLQQKANGNDVNEQKNAVMILKLLKITEDDILNSPQKLEEAEKEPKMPKQSKFFKSWGRN